MRVIPVGYGNPKHRPLIEQLMQEANTLLVDVRYSKASAIPGWHSASLVRRFERYITMGHVLGNVNYKNGGPIEIVDMEAGLPHLYSLLQQGYTVLPMCGCSQYEPSKEHPEGCHRKRICEALSQRYPGVEIVLPETILAREQKIEQVSTMADYWRLPVAQQTQVRQQIGRR